jgi:C1A family cysteine protease
MNTGYLHSSFDGRYYKYIDHDSDSNPDYFILENPFPPKNQGDVPCCVSSAIISCMEILDDIKPPSEMLSTLFHYYNSRSEKNKLENLDIRTGIKAAVKHGVCPNNFHDYSITKDNAFITPSEVAYNEAKKRKIETYDKNNKIQYYRISTYGNLALWKSALYKKKTIAIGFWKTEAYNKIINRETDTHDDVKNLKSDSGHAVAVIGYNDRKKAFIIRDSFGQHIGDNGHWFLPYDLLDSDLILESWVIGKITY